MTQPRDDIPVYELPDALMRPWVNPSFVRWVQARYQRPPRRAGGAALAAAISLLVHALLIGSVVLEASQSPAVRPPDAQGPGSAALVSSAEPVMTLILINDKTVGAKPPEIHTDLASVGMAPADLLVTLLSADPTPAFDTAERQDRNATDAAPPASDTALRALLFGRYTGQIKARIERAWLRPRTPIGAGSFDCRVQITQDHRGNVKETTLQACNGDLRWQLSLVQAIQQASPLSAPPDPRVFADAMVLDFHSGAYVPGGSDEGFEPQRVAAAATSPTLPEPLRAPQSGERTLNDDSVHLTIIGSPAAGVEPGGALSMPTTAP